MLNKGISAEAIEKVAPLFSFTGSFSDKLSQLEGLLQTSEEGMKGVEELRFIIDTIGALGLKTANLDLDVTQAVQYSNELAIKRLKKYFKKKYSIFSKIIRKIKSFF